VLLKEAGWQRRRVGRQKQLRRSNRLVDEDRLKHVITIGLCKNGIAYFLARKIHGGRRM
jgi:hypothetical protein